MKVRTATAEDASELLAIYAGYIDTPATFECTLPSENEFSRRITEIRKEYPYLVCLDDGKVCGYAYAHRFQSREAYQWGAELSIYLDRNMRSRGLGKRLYSFLIELLKQQGVRTVYGCITLPNPRSERLHEKLGFHSVGIFHNAGFKGNIWHNVAWYEKTIAEYTTPSPLLPFSKLPETTFQTLAASYFEQ